MRPGSTQHRPSMQLRHLETFAAIAECGTLTAAAQQLYKTQGAVSHDLKSLERELGTLLIDRSGQRISLTPAGAALLPHAIELLRRAEDIKNEATRAAKGGMANIRIGAPPSLAGGVLKHIVSYRRRTLEARFTFFTELQGILVEWLLDGRLDLAVAEPELRTDLACTSIGREDVLIALRESDPLADSESIVPTALEGLPFIGFIRELSSTRLAERFFTPLGHYPAPVVEVDDFRLMTQLILDGVGFGIMPRSALDGSVLGDTEGLVGVAGDPPLHRDIAVLTRSQRLISPHVADFRDSLVTHWPAGSSRPAGSARAAGPAAASAPERRAVA
jgi:DNA-binding transcriptional LysR family regulator